MEPPPEPLIEEIPYPSGPDCVWLPGSWFWTGVRYVWLPGRYAVPPPDHVWVRSGWVVSGTRYVYVRGYWAPQSYRPCYHYVHPYPPPRRGPAYRTYPGHRGPGR